MALAACGFLEPHIRIINVHVRLVRSCSTHRHFSKQSS